jgi:hypothetical protein
MFGPRLALFDALCGRKAYNLAYNRPAIIVCAGAKPEYSGPIRAESASSIFDG